MPLPDGKYLPTLRAPYFGLALTFKRPQRVSAELASMERPAVTP